MQQKKSLNLVENQELRMRGKRYKSVILVLTTNGRSNSVVNQILSNLLLLPLLIQK